MHTKTSPTPEQTYPILPSFKDQSILAAVTEEPDWSRPNAGTSPLSCYIRGLCRRPWLTLLLALPWLLLLAEEIAQHILAQKSLFAAADSHLRKRVYQQLPRVARRWLVSAYRKPIYRDPHLLYEDVVASLTPLVRARALPQDDHASLTFGFVGQEAKRIVRLSTGDPLVQPDAGRGRPEPTQVWRQDYGRPSIDPTDPLLPVVPIFLSELRAFLAPGIPTLKSVRTARWLLINALGIHYGLTPRACTHVRINCAGGPLSLWPAAGKAILELSNDYYGASCWRRSDLSLPLLPEITQLLQILGVNRSSGQLGNLFNAPVKTYWAQYLKDQKAWQARFGVLSPCKRATSMHRAHRHIQLLILDVPIQIVSLLEGQPILGSRGPCSYVCASTSELRSYFSAYIAELYRMSGLTPPDMPPLPLDLQIHGALAPSYKEYLDDLRASIDMAWAHPTKSAADRYERHNLALAILRMFEGALGLRRSATHHNLALNLRAWRYRHLQIADKVVSGERVSRILPLTPGLEELIDQVAKLFGDCREVLYLDRSGTCYTLSHLPRAAFNSVSSVFVRKGDGAQPGRTAFIDQLRRDGYDERTCYAAAGHAPQMHMWDWHRPESVDSLAEITTQALSEFFARHGVDDLARDLAALLRACCLPHCVTPIRDPIDLPDPNQSMPIGISREADRIGFNLEALLHAPATSLPPFDRLALYLGLRGVPPTNLHNFRAYYSLRHFVHEQKTGQPEFVMLVRDTDAGFMSPYFVPLPPEDSGLIRNLILECESSAPADFCPPKPREFYSRVKEALAMSGVTTRVATIIECLRVRCRWLLPGYIAGQLLGLRIRVLNHIDYRDVFAVRGVIDPQLVHRLDGSPFTMPHQRPLVGKVKMTTPQRIKARDLPPNDIDGRAKIAMRMLKPARYAVSQAAIEEAAKLVSQTAPKSVRQKVQSRIKALMRANSQFAVSPPKRILLPHETARFLDGVKKQIAKTKPKFASAFLRRNTPAWHEAIARDRNNLTAAIYTLLLGGLRICEVKEAFALRAQVSLSQAANHRGTVVVDGEVYFGIPKSKTPAGIRVASTATCCPPSLRPYLPILCQAILAIHGAHSHVRNKAVEHILARALPGKPLTPHDLRRSGIAGNQILATKGGPRNNLLASFAHSRKRGHISTLITDCSYSGSAMKP